MFAVIERMNVFTTDHPLASEPSPALLRYQRRLLRGCLAVIIAYPIYLLLLGPYWALLGPGRLDFLPQTVRSVPLYPAMPGSLLPALWRPYEGYLNWWYCDPNAADPETGSY